MAEFAAALAPGDDFPAVEMMSGFRKKLVLARWISVNNFAVIENRLNYLRCRFGTQCQRIQRSASGTASGFFARQECRAKRSTRVAGNRLDVDVAKAAALF